MKKLIILWSSAAILTALSARAQSFVNLNFESAQIIPVSTNASGSLNITIANAFPGWNAFLGTNQLSSTVYNPTPLLGGPGTQDLR